MIDSAPHQRDTPALQPNLNSADPYAVMYRCFNEHRPHPSEKPVPPIERSQPPRVCRPQFAWTVPHRRRHNLDLLVWSPALASI